MSQESSTAQSTNNAVTQTETKAVETAAAAIESTKVEATATTESTTEGTKTEPEKPAEPTKYELKSEGLILDASQVEKTIAQAKQLGLTNDQAQALLNEKNEALSSYVSAQQEQLKTKSAEWLESVKADKDLGGEKLDQTLGFLKEAKEGKYAFIEPELVKILDETGLGNHPLLIKSFVRASKLINEQSSIGGGKPASGEGTFLDGWYSTK